jgi:hypothetical protein
MCIWCMKIGIVLILYRISHGLWCYMIFIQLNYVFVIPELGRGDRKHTTISIKSQNMEDSFYLLFTTQYLFLFTLFFGLHGVGIHSAIKKSYKCCHIDIEEMCDKYQCLYNRYVSSGKKLYNLRYLIFMVLHGTTNPISTYIAIISISW